MKEIPVQWNQIKCVAAWICQIRKTWNVTSSLPQFGMTCALHKRLLLQNYSKRFTVLCLAHCYILAMLLCMVQKKPELIKLHLKVIYWLSVMQCTILHVTHCSAYYSVGNILLGDILHDNICFTSKYEIHLVLQIKNTMILLSLI